MEYANYIPFTLVSLPILIVHGVVAFTLKLAFGLSLPIQLFIQLSFNKRGNKNVHPACFRTLLWNDLKRDVARFTTLVQTCFKSTRWFVARQVWRGL